MQIRKKQIQNLIKSWHFQVYVSWYFKFIIMRVINRKVFRIRLFALKKWCLVFGHYFIQNALWKVTLWWKRRKSNVKKNILELVIISRFNLTFTTCVFQYSRQINKTNKKNDSQRSCLKDNFSIALQIN